MYKNTPQSFGSIAKLFHWIMALGVLGMLAAGLIMVDMEPSPEKMTLYKLHKSTGVFILLLGALRLMWRLFNPVPHMPATLRPWHHHLAKLSPWSLYALLFLIPLSGIALSQSAGYPITVYDLWIVPTLFSKDLSLLKTASLTHRYAAFALIGLLILHISAALYHHFILKTNVLRRMLPSWFQKD